MAQEKSMASKLETPEGYFIPKDGIWGEYTVILDDEFGTVLAYDFVKKEDAIKFALDHKKNNS